MKLNILKLIIMILIIVNIFPHRLKRKTDSTKTRTNKFRVSSRKAFLKNSAKFYSQLNAKKQDSAKYFDNPSWVAKGYNILFGNPKIAPQDGGLIDSGFASQIFQITYDDKITSGDRKYYIPDNFEVDAMQACKADFSSKSTTTVEELKNSLAVSVGLKVGYGPFAFGANTEFSNMASSITTKNKVYITSNAECGLYVFKVLEVFPPKLHSIFIRYLKTLEGIEYNSNNEQKFSRFFSAYGTHYLSKIIMGSRYTYVEEMSSDDLETLKSQGVKVEVEASASAIVSVSAKTSVDNQSSSRNAYKSKVSNHWATSIGAPMPSSLKREDWLSGTSSTPMPISYELVPIQNLLINSIDLKEELKTKGINSDKIAVQLTKAYDDYCDSLVRNKVVSACVFKDGVKIAKPKDIPLTNIVFTTCTTEGNRCTFGGKKLVKFATGIGDGGLYRIAENGIDCTAAQFGDPYTGRQKTCFVSDWDNGSWKECAKDGQVCNLNQRSIIAYGSNSNYIITEARQNIICNQSNLKDYLKRNERWENDRVNPTLEYGGFNKRPSGEINCIIKTHN